MVISMPLFTILSVAFYLWLGIGIPILIIWFATTYIKGMQERNRLLSELIKKIDK